MKKTIKVNSRPLIGVQGQERALPFELVCGDAEITFGERRFRVMLYGAYNSYGLIGSENNGIAVADEDTKDVLTAGICRKDSGYCGPSKKQVQRFNEILEMDWEQFKQLIAVDARFQNVG